MKLLGIYTGLPKEFSKGMKSAINREKKVGPTQVFFDQLEGDRVANTTHHGGLNRVVHHYSYKSYLRLQELFPASKDLFVPGSIGENICTTDWDDQQMCIGDIFQLGTSLLQVTEPRKPCRTIDMKYGIKGLARKIQEHQVTGCFFKVLKEGSFDENDELIRIENQWPAFTVARVTKELLIARNNTEFLQRMVEHPILSDNWKEPASRFIQSGAYKSDAERLGE